MTKPDVKQLDAGQLDAMYNMLRMGFQTANIPALKEHCDLLRQAMIQKDAGQRKDSPACNVKFEDLGTIINCIVIEAMCLYLSGDLDKLGRTDNMTTMIKLTRVPSKWAPADEGPIFINPAQVTKIYQDPEISEATIVDFHDAVCSIVKETPEEIAEMIFNAEHPECKL